MKKYLLIVIFGFIGLYACKEPVREKSTNADNHPEKKAFAEGEKKIASLNFNEFENQYANTSKDTLQILNFWATWCKPCIKELPAFEAVTTNLKHLPIKVVLVSLDFPEKLESAVIPFLQKNEIKSEVILLDDPDANNWIPKVSENWSGAIPATLMVYKKEKYFFEKSFTFEELNIQIENILNNKNP